MSPREQVAHNLADTCTCSGLNESYGVSIGKGTDAKGKSYWAVTFAKARVLDGVLHVYSPNFILIKWQGMGNGKTLQVLRSEASTKEFIINKFVKGQA